PSFPRTQAVYMQSANISRTNWVARRKKKQNRHHSPSDTKANGQDQEKLSKICQISVALDNAVHDILGNRETHVRLGHGNGYVVWTYRFGIGDRLHRQVGGGILTIANFVQAVEKELTKALGQVGGRASVGANVLRMTGLQANQIALYH